jgi:hypothetical protein
MILQSSLVLNQSLLLPWRLSKMDSNNINTMDTFRLANASLYRWRKLIDDEVNSDIIEKIEEIIEALEYIDGWEPSDAMIQDHIDSRGMF